MRQWLDLWGYNELSEDLHSASQGSMDGLCGVYAIINALSITSIEVDKEAIFRVACSAPPRSRWPDVLWHGTTIFDMQKMIRRCLEELEIIDTRVSYPYMRNTPSTNDRYWAGFDEAFKGGAARCAIMGTTSPDMHGSLPDPMEGILNSWILL